MHELVGTCMNWGLAMTTRNETDTILLEHGTAVHQVGRNNSLTPKCNNLRRCQIAMVAVDYCDGVRD